MIKYCQMGEITIMEAMKRFMKIVKEILGTWYLKQPTKDDIESQLKINEDWGFSAMFVTLDCKYYSWKICPIA
jgi:hypothetical protein